jgi:predicted ABC-type ATPase
MNLISDQSKLALENQFLSSCIPERGEPVICSMAGIPAAGKTTFVDISLKQGDFPNKAFLLNPDEVMERLPEYLEDIKIIGKEGAFEKWEMPSRELSFELLERALDSRFNIIKDMGCVRAENVELLGRLKKRGYQVKLFYIYCCPEEAIKRAKARSRYVPESEIFSRFESINRLLPLLEELADEFVHIDNTDLSKPFIIMDKS